MDITQERFDTFSRDSAAYDDLAGAMRRSLAAKGVLEAEPGGEADPFDAAFRGFMATLVSGPDDERALRRRMHRLFAKKIVRRPDHGLYRGTDQDDARLRALLAALPATAEPDAEGDAPDAPSRKLVREVSGRYFAYLVEFANRYEPANPLF